jgi:FtsH-binding integral membrane protein
MIALAVLGSVSLLIASLRRSEEHPDSRGWRTAAVAGALGLLWVACRFYWHSYDLYKHSYWGLVRQSSVAVAFYLCWRLLTGATIATLTFVAFPKAAKVVLGIAAALSLASILFAIGNRDRLALTGSAWSIGLAIPSIVLIWFDANEKKRQLRTVLPGA